MYVDIKSVFHKTEGDKQNYINSYKHSKWHSQ